MALQEVYEYLYDNNLMESKDPKFIEILARHHANVSMLPSVSMDCEELINEIMEDIELYGEEETTWIYFINHDNLYIPHDYMLEYHDVLDEDEYYIKANLKQTLEIFKLLDNI